MKLYDLLDMDMGEVSDWLIDNAHLYELKRIGSDDDEE